MAQYVIKPSDVYTAKPEIPEGWRFVAFRPPIIEDLFIGSDSAHFEVYASPINFPSLDTLGRSNCRIIVERIPAPAMTPKNTRLPAFYVPIKDVYGINNPEIPRGWQAVAFRYPKHGEYFLCTEYEARVRRADWLNGTKALPRIILEPIPAPEEGAADDWWE